MFGRDERYAFIDEFLTVLNRLLRGETVTFKGKYVHVVDAGIPVPPTQPHVPMWFGGSSPAAHAVAAKHIDTYLSWGETPEQSKAKIREVRTLAAAHGRADKIRFGIRLYVIVCETEDAAWAAAQDLSDHMDEGAVAGAQAYVAGIDPIGQQRMSALHGGRKPKDLRELEIAPNLWSAIGLVRHGPGTAPVGSAKQVLQRIQDYRDAGNDVVIVSGMPLLEEAYRFGELVLPHLDVDRRAAFGVTSAFTKDRDAAWRKSARYPGCSLATASSDLGQDLVGVGDEIGARLILYMDDPRRGWASMPIRVRRCRMPYPGDAEAEDRASEERERRKEPDMQGAPQGLADLRDLDA